MDEMKVNKNIIKIGFKHYCIEKPDEIAEVKASFYGTSDYDREVIKIANKYEQHDKNCTFIHEILHCICNRFDLNDLNTDEQAICLLSLGIYEAIIDNPHLFKMADI